MTWRDRGWNPGLEPHFPDASLLVARLGMSKVVGIQDLLLSSCKTLQYHLQLVHRTP